MAWTTPPTFSTGDILTAAQLNILSDDLAYLEGRGAAPNVPTLVYVFTVTRTITARITHRHRYVHYKVVAPAGSPGPDSAIVITYNGNTVLNQTPIAATTTYSGSVDSNSWGLTVGDDYTISIAYTKDDAETGVYLEYIEERDAA